MDQSGSDNPQWKESRSGADLWISHSGIRRFRKPTSKLFPSFSHALSPLNPTFAVPSPSFKLFLFTFSLFFSILLLSLFHFQYNFLTHSFFTLPLSVSPYPQP